MAILKWSRGFRRTIDIFKKLFPCYHPNVLSKLFWMVCMSYGPCHAMPAFSSNIKMEQMQMIVLKQSCDLSKILIFFKSHFHSYRPNIFSKFSWMGDKFYGLWYMLPTSFVKYWNKVITDLGLNRSHDVIQFFSLVLCKHCSKSKLFAFWDLRCR